MLEHHLCVIIFLGSICLLAAALYFYAMHDVKQQKIRRGKRLLAVLENFRTGKGKPCCLCKHVDDPVNIEYANCDLTKTEVFDKFGGLVRCSSKIVEDARQEHGDCGPDGKLFEQRELTDSDLEYIALTQKSGQPNLKQGC